ncbi:hypothetical protein GDO86_000899 [Hymenochirus boettgeri]|uniref:Signal-transducing adaptor protein 2 n=1 Tax=Hymenochirus boettgeri TaxID=247094 RepID=A0A8T2KBE8_9PIPI|nr:hypothetical protein GDO86_000899 [Hymenochirus boettgeri]
MSRMKAPVPEHYYEEYLYKKDHKSKVYRKFWVGLLGNSLCFYSNHKDLQCVDIFGLENYVSLKEPSGNSSSEFLFTLCLQGGEVQLKAESLESREMWRVYIVTIAELRIPPSASLLPGPLLALKEALEKEKQRRRQKEAEEKPSCFFNVSRPEAENLLKQNYETGNLLLRPGGDQISVSVTTCQKNHSNFILKHYRVTQEQDSYVIQVDPKIVCSSLAHVVSHFVNSSNKLLFPFVKQNEYENKIAIIETNNEDGVVTVTYPLGNTGATKASHVHKLPPPLPRGPHPDEEYENPDEGQNKKGRSSDVSDGKSTLPPVLNSGLDDELKRKLQIRREQIE